MAAPEFVTTLRVRYSETDQMGTYYNSRPLEWFECARTEALRALGLPYTLVEERGVRLPMVEAHVQFQGPARYDDELTLTTRVWFAGKARLKFEVRITLAGSGAPVASGYTVHAVVDSRMKPVRPPDWLARQIPEQVSSEK